MRLGTFTCISTVILLASVAIADKRFVEASRPEDARNVRAVNWVQGDEGSDLVLRDGVPFKILEQDGATVITSFHDVGKRFRVDIYAINHSDERFEIYPERVSFVMTSPKDKALSYVPMEKLAKGIKRKAAWAAAFAGLGGNATETLTSTTEATGSGTTYAAKTGNASSITYSGSATTTSVVPDHETRADSRATVRRIHEQASDELSQLKDVALQANTLLPGEEVFGSVFFQKNGDIQTAVVTVPAGPRAFAFPVVLTRKKS